MKAFLNDKLDLIGPKNFKFIAPALCLSSDIMFLVYINSKLASPAFMKEIVVRVLSLQGVSHLDVSRDYLIMLEGALKSSFSFMLACILFYNLVIYLLSITKFSWPKSYIKGYAFSAVLLSLIEMVFTTIKLNHLNYVTFITTILYFLAYYGIKYFQKTQELQTENHP